MVQSFSSSVIPNQGEVPSACSKGNRFETKKPPWQVFRRRLPPLECPPPVSSKDHLPQVTLSASWIPTLEIAYLFFQYKNFPPNFVSLTCCLPTSSVVPRRFSSYFRIRLSLLARDSLSTRSLLLFNSPVILEPEQLERWILKRKLRK